MMEQHREIPERPLLLTLGMVWSFFVALVVGIAVLVKLVTALGQGSEGGLMEGIHEGHYLALLLAGLLGAIGWGIWKRKWWTRPAIVVFWLMCLASAATEIALGKAEKVAGCNSVGSAVLSGGFAALYLYAKRNVKAYYSALEALSAGEQAGRAA